MNDSSLFVPNYKWAKAVKDISNNRCAFCGKEERLHAHHIIPRSAAPDMANNLDNGIALCAHCHRIAHNTGWHRAKEIIVNANTYNPNTAMGRMQAFIRNYAETRLIISIPNGYKEIVEAVAAKRGESVNAFINRAIAETIERDTKKTEG